jgi:hypothetical protein
MDDSPLKRSSTQQLFRSKNVTIMPKVAMAINTCKAKQIEYRILFPEDEEDIKNLNRMTIVVSEDGNLVKQYYG